MTHIAVGFANSWRDEKQGLLRWFMCIRGEYFSIAKIRAKKIFGFCNDILSNRNKVLLL